ncbi:hypothetical protein ACFLW4_00535 [Chloroflexota bacterium]
MIEKDIKERIQFEHKLDQLQKIIMDGVAYFTLWRCLMVDDDNTAQALNRYKGIFSPARNALFWSALLQLSKVYDKDTRTVSLVNLLKLAKNNTTLVPYANTEELEQLQQSIDNNTEILGRLKSFRDQRLAHYDANLSGDIQLPYGEIRVLLEQTQSIYKSLKIYHEKMVVSFDYIVKQIEFHASNVIRLVVEEREKDIRKINEANQKIADICNVAKDI